MPYELTPEEERDNNRPDFGDKFVLFLVLINIIAILWVKYILGQG